MVMTSIVDSRRVASTKYPTTSLAFVVGGAGCGGCGVEEMDVDVGDPVVWDGAEKMRILISGFRRRVWRRVIRSVARQASRRSIGGSEIMARRMESDWRVVWTVLCLAVYEKTEGNDIVRTAKREWRRTEGR